MIFNSQKFKISLVKNSQKKFPYNFFWDSQRKADIKILAWTQYEISKDRCDWHILVGNDERIKIT